MDKMTKMVYNKLHKEVPVKTLTKLWNTMCSSLCDISMEEDGDFTEEVYDKFDEIFDIKDVIEYKRAVKSDIVSPSEFQHISNAMRRAFVEGYILAQIEHRKKEVAMLYNCYRSTEKEK